MKSLTPRIACIDFYDANSPVYRDPIQIPMSLRSAGFYVELVTRCDCDVEEIHGFPVSRVRELLSGGEIADRFQCVIAISRFDPSLSDILKRIKAGGVPLIVKGDTDGTLGYPIVPNYLRSVPLTAGGLNVLRHLKWRLPFKSVVASKLQHFEYADRVVYESPGAGVNLAYVLNYWGLRRYVAKLAWIPNSVHDDYLEGTLPEKDGLKIVAVGRWDDRLVKGADILARVISGALNGMEDIRFAVIGSGEEIVRQAIPERLLERVEFTGQLDVTALKKLLREAKIMIVPSRLESFSIASAEALCSGCSLVVTPVESLVYLSGGGAFGSVSRDFRPSSLMAALDHEIKQWRGGARRSDQISNYWRSQLSKEKIGQQWVDLVTILLRQ